VPIKTAPNNNAKLSTILMLVNSQEHQGIGKLFIHENLAKNQTGIISEKMNLVCSIFLTTTPVAIKIMDYHSEIKLEYNFLIDKTTKSTDFMHMISVIIKNQSNFFQDPEMVLVGNAFSGEKPKV
jgi:hypothetical protein